MPPAANSDEELTGIDQVAETSIPETDGGPARAGAAASADHQRRCIATMESRPQHAMIRFVLSPDAVVTPDLAGRLPGRGAWVTSSRDAVDLAVKKGAFARAFKAQAKTPPDLAKQVEQLLSRRILDQLGLAKRAGELILGFEQVRESIRGEKPACVIEASDGAADGRDKVLALLRGVHSGQGERLENLELPPVTGCFSADELGMALGRERVIHACLKQGRFANSWMGELARLSGFRTVFWPAGRPSPDARQSVDGSAGAPGEKIEDAVARASGGDPPDPLV
jgi:predicted RNA-binding protein YlxR (DUF448 family)